MTYIGTDDSFDQITERFETDEAEEMVHNESF